MENRDRCADMLGIECLEVADGFARFRMTVRGDMLNMHGTCHGGIIFTLAGVAFAFAANSDKTTAVLQSASIDYLEPVYEGDVLVATATARVRKKRTGIYDIEVRNQSDNLVSLVTDRSFTLKREQSA